MRRAGVGLEKGKVREDRAKLGFRRWFRVGGCSLLLRHLLHPLVSASLTALFSPSNHHQPAVLLTWPNRGSRGHVGPSPTFSSAAWTKERGGRHKSSDSVVEGWFRNGLLYNLPRANCPRTRASTAPTP